MDEEDVPSEHHIADEEDAYWEDDELEQEYLQYLASRLKSRSVLTFVFLLCWQYGTQLFQFNYILSVSDSLDLKDDISISVLLDRFFNGRRFFNTIL